MTKQNDERFSISLRKVKENSLFAPKKMYVQHNLAKENIKTVKRGDRVTFPG